MNHNIAVFFRCFLVLILGACAVGGALFEDVDIPPSDKADIYFYRPRELQGGGLSLQVFDNGSPLVNIDNGQFVKTTVAPGKHKFFYKNAKADNGIEIEAEAGKTYFVRYAIRHGVWKNALYLSRVYPEEALRELKVCCKSGK